MDIKGIRREGVNWILVLRIRTSSGPLWTDYEPASLHKMREIFLLSEGLLADYKYLYSLQLFEM
jgi:hypothetical protein